MIFYYIISVLGIVDIYFNTYVIFSDKRNDIFNYLVMPFYITEIMLKFMTKYQKDIYIVSSPSKIAKRYLKFQFWIDVIASVPLFVISHEFLILKMARILKIQQYMSCIEKLEQELLIIIFSAKEALIKLTQSITKNILYLSFAIHFFASGWIWVSQFHGKDGWIHQNENLMGENPEDYDIYIASFYTIVTIFASVGYGDFSWGQNGELIYQIIVQLIGIGIFGYVFGNMSNILGKMNNLHSLKEQKQEDVQTWLLKMSNANKEKAMHNSFYNYIMMFYKAMWNKDYNSIFDSRFTEQLKPALQDELLDHLYSKIYEKYDDFFKGHERQFVRELVKEMRYQSFELFPLYMEKYKEDFGSIPPIQPRKILEKGRIPFAVFFIIEGEVYASNTTGKYIYFKFNENSVIGETHLISGIPYSYSVFHHESDSIQAFVIPGKTFLKV
jgi:hypothetical protein